MEAPEASQDGASYTLTEPDGTAHSFPKEVAEFMLTYMKENKKKKKGVHEDVDLKRGGRRWCEAPPRNGA